MLIDCPGCAKAYHIIKAALGPNGRRVACPRCDTIWFVAASDGAAQAGARATISAPIEISVQDRPRRPLPEPRLRPERPIAPALRPRTSAFLRDFCTGAALLALAMAALGLRAEIVRLWPQSEAAYAALGLPVNLRGLELRGLHTTSLRDGAEPVLGIEGEIANIRSGETEVPAIELSIRNAQGFVLYGWTVAPQKRRLAASESILFRARLADPPAGAREVVARFAPTTLALR